MKVEFKRKGGNTAVGKTAKAKEISGNVEVKLKAVVRGKYNNLTGIATISGIPFRVLIDIDGLKVQYSENVEEALKDISEDFTLLLNTILSVIDSETEITGIRAEVTRRMIWVYVRTKESKIKAEITNNGLRVYETIRIAKNKYDEYRNVKKDFEIPEEVEERVRIILTFSV